MYRVFGLLDGFKLMKNYSESKPPGDVPGNHQVPVYELHYAGNDEGISLVDLWRVIFTRKKLIMLSVVAAVLIAAAYIFMIEPVYQAQTYLVPSQQQDLYELQIDYRGNERFSIEKYTPEVVFQMFQKNFKLKGLRREYWRQRHLADQYLEDKPHTDILMDNLFDSKFDSGLRVQLDEQNASLAVATFEYSEPVPGSQWLNQFVTFVKESTLDLILDDIKFMIAAEISQVRYQIDSQLKLAEKERRDKIQLLSEALRVAKTLDIEDTSGLIVGTDKEQSLIEVKTTQAPLYMRGSRALKSEITVLESRKSDEAFIGGLRDLQEKLAFLENISVDRDAISVVTVDTEARSPYRAQKPRKTLIVVLAVALGLVIGVLLAFTLGFDDKESREN